MDVLKMFGRKKRRATKSQWRNYIACEEKQISFKNNQEIYLMQNERPF
jgi:hypothetical protein